MPTIQVTRSLTRNYGAYSSTWSIGYEVDISSRADLLREYAKCDEHLHAAMLDFESNALKTLPETRGKSIDQDKKGQGREEKWVKAIGISEKTERGKFVTKVHTAPGTQFAKFGLSLYWDNFKGMSKQEFDKRRDPEGDHVLPDDFYVLAVKEGEYWRARAIAHKDMIETGV